MCASSAVGCGGGKPHMNVRPLSLAALDAKGSFAVFAEKTAPLYMKKTWRKGIEIYTYIE